MKRIAFVALVIGFSLHNRAMAQQFETADLYTECQVALKGAPTNQYEAIQLVHCGGYVRGIADGILAAQNSNGKSPLTLCISEQVTILELEKVIVHYFDKDPGRLNEPRIHAVTRALTDAYSCHKPS